MQIDPKYSSAALLAATLMACAQTTRETAPEPPNHSRAAGTSSSAPDAAAVAAIDAAPAEPPLPPQLDADGDDDPVDVGQGAAPAHAHFARVGKPPASLWRICDLTPFEETTAGGRGNQRALYAAHATAPLGLDGATVSRYAADGTFTIAFDWNRYGEPTTGGGAGQGFLRVHAIGGRLFVTDADPPYNGFGISEPGTEGFVYISDANGKFAPARAPGHRPPLPPSDGGAGAGVLPRAYHVIDAIRFRGRYYASTGSVPPKERAWAGPSPGALHVANEDFSRWTYEVDYPFPWQSGVWRLGFMTRFKDRLYAGIQDYDGREPNDFVYFDPPAGTASITHDDVHGVNVSGMRGTSTLRWYVDGAPGKARLFWVALHRDGSGVLRATRDGDHWTTLVLPAGAGRPTDITRFRDALVVLTERGLYRLGDDDVVTKIGAIEGKKSPFEIKDTFCAAPIAVFENALYAGGQIDGALYRLDADLQSDERDP